MEDEREVLVQRILEVDRELGRLVQALAGRGEQHVATRLVEARRSVAAAAVGALEAGC